MASRPEDPKTANDSASNATGGHEAQDGPTAEPLGSEPDTEDGEHTGIHPIHPAAENIIALFGGIRPMAHKLSIPVTTVQGWKKRGVIPEARHTDIMIAAESHGIVIEPAELRAAAGSDDGDKQEGASLADGTATAVEAEEVTVTPGSGGQAAGDRQAVGPADRTPRGEGATAGAAPSDEQRAAAAPAPVERRGGGAWLAALIAIAAAAAAITVPWWGPRYLPALWQVADTAGLADRVAALEGALEGTPEGAAASAGPDGVPARFDAIEERLAVLEAAPAGAGGAPAGSADLDGAIAGLEARLDGLEAAGGGADPAAAEALAALTARVGELEAMVVDVTEPPLGAEPERVAELADRVASLEQGLAGGDPGQPEIAAALDPLAREVEQAQAATSALADRVDAVDGRVAAAVDELAAALTGFDARLAGVETIGERVSRGVAAEQTLALAFGQLRDQLDREEPFAVAYATISNIVANDPDLVAVLEPLAEHAATGVPTRADLSGRFPALANDVLAAADTVEDPGWIDTVLANVRGLVTVRRSPGLVAGDDPDAILARAEYHVLNGAFDTAVAEMETLDAGATEAVDAWVADARARLAAETALTTLAGAISTRLTTGADAGDEASQ